MPPPAGRRAVVLVVETVHQCFVEAGVLDVEVAVRTQVGEGVARQAERGFDGFGGTRGQGDAGAFQHQHHAEEADGVAAGDGVVGVGDHQLGGLGRLRALGGVAVGAAGDEVVEDPLVVARFFPDVFANRGAQPFQPCRQACAAGHQQRHGMAHVVERFDEEGDVVLALDAAGQRILDDRDRQQRVALGPGLREQTVVEGDAVGGDALGGDALEGDVVRCGSGHAAVSGVGSAGRKWMSWRA
jgi:hypothetical protein